MYSFSILDFIKSFFQRKSKNLSQAEEEIKGVLEDFRERKVLGKFEEKLILSIFDFKELKVRELTIPRNILVGLDISLNWEEVKKILINHTHYFYPVYKKNFDNFLGYVALRDLIKGFNEISFNWTHFIKPSLIIPENISFLSAIEKMLEKKVEIAFVVDELSELTGILRLKDILKELIKTEIKCPHPDEEGWLLIHGTYKIRELKECLGIDLPKGDFETISGLIIDQIKRIPKTGEKIKLSSLEVEIIKADEKRIHILKIRPLNLNKSEKSN